MQAVENRVVAVLAGRQGSGVLLTPHLVLTSAHVVEGDGEIWASAPGRDWPEPCELLWADRTGHCDSALLRTQGPLLPTSELPLLRWGSCEGWQPLPGCQVLGFPHVQRYGADDLEAAQLPGTLTPVSGRLRSRYVLRLDHHPPRARDTGSPWAGLSGGPLFAGPVLVGIAAEDSEAWQHSAITAVPLSKILFHGGLITLLERHWLPGRPPVMETVSSLHPEDSPYEALYAQAIRTCYGRLEIFGLDDLGTSENNWDLDTAYLSLEAHEPRPEPVTGLAEPSPEADADGGRAPDRRDRPAWRRPEPQRIEDLLRSRPRVVLRGEAGAGKTTLVWWLASHAAWRTLPAKLDALNGLVPFVIPMRSLAARGITTPTPAQLPTIAQLPVDGPPDGWAGRVLAAGRALLLVDGLDELPQAEREPARKWLVELLRMYPRTRCLVTVRPLAVEDAWLASEGFEELRLRPMSDADIQAFVTAWHKAARLEWDQCADGPRAEQQRDRIGTLCRELTQEFQRNAGLRDLARTPLLCAVICALHRRRAGLLPRTRWELYRAALNMLLGSRDAYRRIHRPEGIELETEDARQLLQRIAVWLVRNQRAELSRKQAEHQLSLAMKGLRRVREQGSARAVLTHLLNRTGLLQELAVDSLQFIHRTFQDYLAAKEFQDSDSLDELLGHAAEEQWQDVIRLVVGHCGRTEEHRVVEALLAEAEAAEGRYRQWPLRALAAECATAAAYLDDDQHDAVWEGLRALGPPRDQREMDFLTSLGPDVIKILPEPDGLPAGPAGRIVIVLASLGEAAIPLLKRYGHHPSAAVRDNVARMWGLHDPELYAAEVLAGMRLDDIGVPVSTFEQLSRLPRLGPVGHLHISQAHCSDSLQSGLRGRRVHSLFLGWNRPLRDLDFLRGHPEIEALGLHCCPQLRDISALSGTALCSLHLDVRHLAQHALAVLPTLPRLITLRLNGLTADGGGRLPPPHPGVRRLEVLAASRAARLDGIERWTSLRELSLRGPLRSALELGHLVAGPPLLSSLTLQLDGLDDLDAAAPLPRIGELTLVLGEKSVLDERIPAVFPALRELRVDQSGRGGSTLDVSALRAGPSLRLQVWIDAGDELRVVGAERFGERLTVREL
ncbi:NACHT domain-containing protein [Streptomyces gamaensis]|uniref:NACHT domain-containing protein n=1 Tax=Streptomyces gamaensis TaxID=1763542 RepID=A0ABW0Z9L9_9ACTN